MSILRVSTVVGDKPLRKATAQEPFVQRVENVTDNTTIGATALVGGRRLNVLHMNLTHTETVSSSPVANKVTVTARFTVIPIVRWGRNRQK